MKLIICIVQNEDSRLLQDELTKASIRTTKLSSTGGFLRSGNTTFLLGVEDDRVQKALKIIEDNCASRTQTIINPPTIDYSLDPGFSYPIDVDVSGATVFVLDVDQFIKF